MLPPNEVLRLLPDILLVMSETVSEALRFFESRNARELDSE